MEKVRIQLTFFVLFISIYSIHAKCSRNGLSVFPSGNLLRPNSIIVIDGYAMSQEIVKGLEKKYPVYLKSKTKKINLKVKEILFGQFKKTQAVLVPEAMLTAGEEYTLIIDKLPEDESLDRWNKELQKSEPVVYKVLKNEDTIKPTFKTTPKEIRKSYKYFGCGPSVHVDFECQVIDSSEYLIKTTVRNIKLNYESTYYLESYTEATISIGYGMCSGAFFFDEGDDYEVEFSIMDASGNFTPWTGERIKFTKPTELDFKDKP